MESLHDGRRRLALAEALSFARQIAPLDHPAHEPVSDRFRASEAAVTLDVGVHPLELLAGVFGVDLVDAGAVREHLGGVDLDVARGPL